MIYQTGLKFTKTTKIFKYKKNNNKYLDGAKLYKQIVKKALPIAKALYSKYSLDFLFNNAISHLIYAKNGF